jgi:hypothetical protein
MEHLANSKHLVDDSSSRRLELSNQLDASGLFFERDNDMCLQYVYLGVGALYNSPNEIVTIMAQNRFLNEYCDYDAGMRLARDQCANIRLPRDQWLQRVRRCVLQQAGYTKFPTIWPWLLPNYSMLASQLPGECNLEDNTVTKHETKQETYQVFPHRRKHFSWSASQCTERRRLHYEGAPKIFSLNRPKRSEYLNLSWRSGSAN